MPKHKCILCSTVDSDDMVGGDWWDGLCPSCADAVSEYMDARNVSRAVAIRDLDNDPWEGGSGLSAAAFYRQRIEPYSLEREWLNMRDGSPRPRRF